MTANFRELLPVLARHQVRFIVVGGGAAIAHGSARATQDVDVVYARDPENIGRLAAALGPHAPYLRGADSPFAGRNGPFKPGSISP